MIVADLIGVPFVEKGRNPKTGLDCYGLATEVYRRYGINLPEYDGTHNEEETECFYSKESQKWCRVNGDLPVPCLIAFSYGAKNRMVNHCGVYVGNNKFIHALRDVGVVIGRLHGVWKNQVIGFYQWKEGDK